MRSYKDNLLEYLEEQQFAALTKGWCTYLNHTLSPTTTNFQLLLSYPPIQCETDLEEFHNQISSPNLADVYYFISSNKINETSTKLINRIECVEDRLLSKYGIKNVKNWLDFKSKQKMQSNAFNYLESLQEWIKGEEDEELVLEVSENSKLRIDFINNYYNKRYHEKSVDSKVKEEVAVQEVKIDFTSQSKEAASTNLWTEQIIEEGFPFFVSKEDLTELNQRAKVAVIDIKGEVKGFRKLHVEPQNTSDLELFKAILFDHKADIRDAFEHEELNDLKGSLNHTMQAFYSISEFDFTLEIDNDFTPSDVELLRNVSFNCFPFYFSNKVKHFKWIELSEEGKLKIRIKSKKPQTIIVGAEIKKLNE